MYVYECKNFIYNSPCSIPHNMHLLPNDSIVTLLQRDLTVMYMYLANDVLSNIF